MKLDAEQFKKFSEMRDKLVLKAAELACHPVWNFLHPFKQRRLKMRVEALEKALQEKK